MFVGRGELASGGVLERNGPGGALGQVEFPDDPGISDDQAVFGALDEYIFMLQYYFHSDLDKS